MCYKTNIIQFPHTLGYILAHCTNFIERTIVAIDLVWLVYEAVTTAMCNSYVDFIVTHHV